MRQKKVEQKRKLNQKRIAAFVVYVEIVIKDSLCRRCKRELVAKREKSDNEKSLCVGKIIKFNVLLYFSLLSFWLVRSIKFYKF